MDKNLAARLSRLGLLLAWMSVQGCASWEINQLSSALTAVGPEKTLKRLEELEPSDRDRSQYLLNRGMLKLYNGELLSSRQDLEQAKALMSSLQAVSLSENFGALTANETLRSYAGTPTEQVLVHAMLAMSYLFSGDLESARVEMLQANVTMSRLGAPESVIGQLASVRFLAGLIYEMNGELDDALISYRSAREIMKSRSEQIPDALVTSMLNVTRRQGNDDDYQKLLDEFNRKDAMPKAGEGEWVVFYFDGVVTNKTEARLSVFEPRLRSLISVVIPQYPPVRYLPRRLTVRSGFFDRLDGGGGQTTEVIEMIEHRAREDLAHQNTKTLAAATVRAVAKYQMVREAQKSGGDLGGLFANIAGVLSEQADVRSWNMLPSSIQVTRTVVALDAPVQLVGKDLELAPLSPSGASRSRRSQYGVALANSLNDRVLYYPSQLSTSPVRPAAPEPNEGQAHEQ